MRVILIIILIFLLTGCTQYVPVAETVIETVVVTETVVETIEDTDKIEQLEEEISEYKKLVLDLDELRKCVYYVYGENSEAYVFGTGFSLKYKDKFYLITAGHIVDGEWGIHKNLGFKDYQGNWVYPELIEYENDYGGQNDYAIFYSNKINDGFEIDEDNDKAMFKISLDEIDDYRYGSEIGQSGSPVIDNNGEVVEITTTDTYTYNTKILDIFKGSD